MVRELCDVMCLFINFIFHINTDVPSKYINVKLALHCDGGGTSEAVGGGGVVFTSHIYTVQSKLNHQNQNCHQYHDYHRCAYLMITTWRCPLNQEECQRTCRHVLYIIGTTSAIEGWYITSLINYHASLRSL